MPLPEGQLNEHEPDVGLRLVHSQRPQAPVVRPEKIIVPMFDGTKGTFEHWIRNVEYHVDQSQLLNGTDSSLCQFLITHLKPGSAPEIVISSRRKTLKTENKPPNSFSTEVKILRKTFEESDDPQRAFIKADQITWDGKCDTLPMLFAELSRTYSIATPGYDLMPIHARDMIKIIMSENKELGHQLHEMVEMKTLLLDDHLILREAQSWMERKKTSDLGSK